MENFEKSQKTEANSIEKSSGMTEAEILKALECCIMNGNSCEGCPLDETKECEKDLMALEKLTLDLITDKNDSIEMYRRNIALLDEQILAKDKEIERLHSFETYRHCRAEAIKEFAERVYETTWYRINDKGELVVGANSENNIPLYKAEDILKIAKEMEVDL